MISQDAQLAQDAVHRLRRRRISRTALSGLFAKAVMFLPTLLIARIAVPYLGSERFGVLMTVLSLLAFLSIAELGLGGSLITALSRAVGTNDFDRARRLTTNGLVIACVMSAAILLVATLLLGTNVGGAIFPGSPSSVGDEATRTITAFGCLFALTLPLTLVNKIQLGLQQGHIANYWQIAAALINFAVASAAIVAGFDLPWIVVGMMSGTLICGIANATHYFLRQERLRPAGRYVEGVMLRQLLKDSSFYLALQVIFTVTYASDTLLVARLLGAGEASVYSLCERLFSIVAVAVSIVTGPLWAAYGEALGSADRRWAINTLRTSTKRIIAASLSISALILLLLQPLLHLLSSGRLSAPLSLAAGMAIWRVIESAGASVSVFMFASEASRMVLLTGVATAAVSFAMKILILPHSGLTVMPVITGMTYLLFCLVPSLIYIRRAQSAKGTIL